MLQHLRVGFLLYYPDLIIYPSLLFVQGIIALT